MTVRFGRSRDSNALRGWLPEMPAAHVRQNSEALATLLESNRRNHISRPWRWKSFPELRKICRYQSARPKNLSSWEECQLRPIQLGSTVFTCSGGCVWGLGRPTLSALWMNFLDNWGCWEQWTISSPVNGRSCKKRKNPGYSKLKSGVSFFFIFIFYYLHVSGMVVLWQRRTKPGGGIGCGMFSFLSVFLVLFLDDGALGPVPLLSSSPWFLLPSLLLTDTAEKDGTTLLIIWWLGPFLTWEGKRAGRWRGDSYKGRPTRRRGGQWHESGWNGEDDLKCRVSLFFFQLLFYGGDGGCH